MHWYLAQQDPPGTSFWAFERTDAPVYTQPFFWMIVGTFIATIVLLILLSRVPSNFRRPITIGITFLAAMFYVIEWLLPKGRTPNGETIAPFFGWFNWLEAVPIVGRISQVLTGMILALGVMSIFRVHFGRLFKRHKDAFFSGILLVSLFAMVIFGLLDFHRGFADEELNAKVSNALRRELPVSDQIAELARLGADSEAEAYIINRKIVLERLYGLRELSKEEYDSQIAEAREEAERQRTANNDLIQSAIDAGKITPEVAALATAGVTTQHDRQASSQMFNLLFTRGLLTMDAAMFSLIGFFILSAAYRAFRIRSIEASILMATALIVLLSFIPLGLALTSALPDQGFASNFRIESISGWLIQTVSVPSIRAIDLGLGLGLLAMALRIMLGLERGVATTD
jgi:hypothetical protein